MKIKFCTETRKRLLELKRSKGISIEGNILKIIDIEGDPELEKYVKSAIKSQKETQKKRLEVTKKVQAQNSELTEAKSEIERVNTELTLALGRAETAKEEALNDLDVLQKKTQNELINVIVKISLAIIIGVGLATTTLYMFSLYYDKETQLIGNTWSNMFGILLTNAFSIVGTIMGVKYASKTNSDRPRE